MDVFRVRKTRDPGSGGSMGTLDSVHSEQVQGIRDSGTKQDDLKQKLEELRAKREELNESSELTEIVKCSQVDSQIREI